MTTFTAYDSSAALRRIAAMPAAQRDTAILEEIVEPFGDMFATMAGGMSAGSPQRGMDKELTTMLRQATLNAARGWQMAPPEEGDESMAAYLGALDQIDAAQVSDSALAALRRANEAFAEAGVEIRIESVRVGVFPFHPGNPQIAQSHGYTGFGAVPGYIVLTLWPDDYTLPRIAPAAAHEFNHQVRFTHQPMGMNVSVGEYIVIEGLAESFAAELYGEELLGPWVSDHTPESLARSKAIIGDALDVRGFNNVRGYIFGDATAERMGLPAAGLPPFAGYAVGYHLVQAYLHATGRSAAEATVIPATEIIAAAGYF